MLADLLRRVAELEDRQAQTARLGIVVEVLADVGAVRVQLPDADDMVSAPLPVLCRKSQDDKDYWLPDVGEEVLCVFLPQALEQGFVVGAFFNRQDVTPAASVDKRHMAFKDGTYWQYDRAAHKFTLHVNGDVQVTATGSISATADGDIEATAGGKINLTAPQVVITGNIAASGPDGAGSNTINGDLSVTGNITAGGAIIDSGGNTNHHSHP
jgi:phage baseplate assembly protein V